jgi:hypothetical protein
MTETDDEYIDRYQLIEGQVGLIRRWRDGRLLRGGMTAQKFAATFSLQAPAEGWYDGAGRFIGDDPDWPDGV